MTDHVRKRMRLSDWDYSTSAIYMVTVCIADRTHRLGRMTESNYVQLSSAGMMVEQEVLSLPEQFPDAFLDEFVVMPNHVHMLIGVKGQRSNSLAAIIGALKSRTTNRYIRGVKLGFVPPFNRHFWQRDYYETIMRNDMWVEQRREYIINNPANWRDDPEME